MYTYSKKSRRRMHAIPAAIALFCMLVFWLFVGNHPAHAEAQSPAQAQSEPLALSRTNITTLLSSENTWQWQLDCYNCVVEPQYDVIYGDVVRLQSASELVLSSRLNQSWKNPSLSWRWTVDRYVERQPLMRLTLHVKETETWPTRTLHYIWHSGLEAGESEALSDFEHLLVVSGKTSKAESWQSIERDLNQDWQEIYEENFPGIESLELALGMPGESGGTGGFIQKLVMASSE
ncbi:DUF3047 domain-containing protein [Bacterioplanoides sp.]|uniref:DUF3047 domain-containing protein n=1 Tax=Bacterioplanoides sp. TaxID=2066072 RepID=UPI003B003A89